MPDKSIYSPSDESSPHIQERGSLRTSGFGQSQFIGSSTGIYFVNTVRRAFADADVRLSSIAQDTTYLSPEDCILADEEDSRGRSGHESTASSRAESVRADSRSYGPGTPAELGRPPPRELARKLFMAYFQTWHRFFPFLHGPSVSKDVELLYAEGDERPQTPLPLARVVILQCLFNLASFYSDLELPHASRIDKSAKVLPHLIGFAAQGDILSIQALFAAQLLFVARMSLRNAVVVAGLLSRAIFLVGLHRCPVRYREFSEEDCEIRKRLFWSIYVLDRFLSQALGHPLGIQDSDVDVCDLTGPECHRRAVPLRYPSDSMPLGSAEATTNAADLGPRVSQDHGTSSTQTPTQGTSHTRRYDILAFQVEYSRLSGRALELFHKSIHIRSIDPRTVLSLRTDLDAWWNSLPSDLQEFNAATEKASCAEQSQPFSAPALFNLLHSQLRLLIHRPWLSLEPSTAEFQSALQVCIGVSRSVISNVKKQQTAGFGLFWPGYLSASWMAGIILAFACQLHLYPVAKGQQEIEQCLQVLSGMLSYWPLARNCHTVLSDLLRTVQQIDSSGAESPAGRPGVSGLKRPFPMTSAMTSSEDYLGRMTEAKRMRSTAGQESMSNVSSSPHDLQTLAKEGQGSSLRDSEAAPLTESNESCVANRASNGVAHTWPAGSQPHAQPVEASGTEQHQQHNHSMFMNSYRSPVPVVQYNDTVDAATYPNPNSLPGSNQDSQWAQWSGVSAWDSGMADVLHGATWESLIQVVNQNHVDWDGQFP